jgi:hypothetical protein
MTLRNGAAIVLAFARAVVFALKFKGFSGISVIIGINLSYFKSTIPRQLSLLNAAIRRCAVKHSRVLSNNETRPLKLQTLSHYMLVAGIAFTCAVSVADAAPRHGRRAMPTSKCTSDNSARVTCAPSSQEGSRRPVVVDANGNPARLITVPTAAGIDVTVAPSFAKSIQGFIADAVAAGYRPRRIKCYSRSHSHVRHSLHFSGQACDFNQHGWGKTDRFMYHVRALAAKWDLRDGCTFRDCGHIDAGRQIARRGRARSARKRWASR